jgi:hypothetical protein
MGKESSGIRFLSDREVAEAIAQSPFHAALPTSYENAFQELRLELAEVIADMDDDEPTQVISDAEREFWKRMG